jgi:hypothetical protein
MDGRGGWFTLRRPTSPLLPGQAADRLGYLVNASRGPLVAWSPASGTAAVEAGSPAASAAKPKRPEGCGAAIGGLASGFQQTASAPRRGHRLGRRQLY